MLAFALLFLTFGLLPEFPVFALMTGSGAVYAATFWKATVGETLELVMFYGALIGCLTAWFGV